MRVQTSDPGKNVFHFITKEYIQTLFKKIEVNKNLNFCNILRSFNETLKETNKDKNDQNKAPDEEFKNS